MSRLKIRNTSAGSDLVNELYANTAVSYSENVIVSRRRNIQGKLVSTFTGQKKVSDLTVSFRNVEKSVLDSIIAYCDVPIDYYVIITNSDNSKTPYSAYSQLSLLDYSHNYDNGLYDFDVNVIEV